jgi:hypothetical protein
MTSDLSRRAAEGTRASPRPGRRHLAARLGAIALVAAAAGAHAGEPPDAAALAAAAADRFPAAVALLRETLAIPIMSPAT